MEKRVGREVDGEGMRRKDKRGGRGEGREGMRTGEGGVRRRGEKRERRKYPGGEGKMARIKVLVTRKKKNGNVRKKTNYEDE